MSLRLRITLTLALVAALGIGVSSWLAYVSTADRLRTETDRFLDRQTRQIVGRNAPPGLLFQLLDNDGEPLLLGPLADRSSPLPIDDGDRAIARAGSGERRRSDDLDGVPIRMVTRGIDPVGPQGERVGAIQVARDESENIAVLASLRRRIALIGVLGTAGAAGAGWMLARRTARPLEELARTAHDVAATQDLATRIPTTGDREARLLGESFATMLSALAEAREQQRRLAQDAGHELRTPLTSLRTNVATLRRHRELPTDQREEILADIDAEMVELSHLVDELVALSAGELPGGQDEPVALDDVVRRVVERARRRGGRTVLVTTSPATVTGRAAALDRAVSNLVDNALKFSPATEPVEVSQRGGHVEVRDHGEGIAPVDLPRVFDRFYRSDASRTLTGSGLGLAIVREVAERHGGTVFATNHPGGGAVVGMDLPATPASTAPTSGADGDTVDA
jgi:two-component system sensor histidine kinase MprB